MLDAANDLGMIFGSICVDEFLKVNTLFVIHGGVCDVVRVYTKQIVFRLLSNACDFAPIFIRIYIYQD
jgi:hypothetical protein